MHPRDADSRRSSSPRRRAFAARLGLTFALVAVAAALAGCGGSSSKSSSTSSSAGGSAAGTSSGGSATIKVASINGYGKALVTASGESVYLLSSDPANGSTCSGSCAKVWVPVTASGKASAGSGANASLVSTFKRSDGTVQVAYDKHALYTHAGTGATSGQGVASDGGVWYLVSATGVPIKKSVSGGGY